MSTQEEESKAQQQKCVSSLVILLQDYDVNAGSSACFCPSLWYHYVACIGLLAKTSPLLEPPLLQGLVAGPYVRLLGVAGCVLRGRGTVGFSTTDRIGRSRLTIAGWWSGRSRTGVRLDGSHEKSHHVNSFTAPYFFT